LDDLKDVRQANQLEDTIKAHWFTHPALLPLAEMELMGDILRTNFAQRIFGKGRRMTNATKRNLWIMSDSKLMGSMKPSEKLDVMNELLADSNRNRQRKLFSLWKMNKDHFRIKGANMSLRMTNSEMVDMYKKLGVINPEADRLLGVGWWQTKKYGDVFAYMRGTKQVDDKMLKNDKQIELWRRVLKTITPEKGKVIRKIDKSDELYKSGKPSFATVDIDKLNATELKQALSLHQQHMLDLAGMGDEMVMDLKARTRMMNTLLKQNLSKIAVRNPSKFTFSDGTTKALGYDLKEGVIEAAIEKHLKNVDDVAKDTIRASLTKRLAAEDGLVQSLERSFNNWLADYNVYLTKELERPMSIPKP
ncbi:MAG: hypothetical protein OYH77_04025, partial [Pseudomonadota bacterium]|nr:hypothetical protein [Pseudomonadota bacterium]